VRSKRVPKTPAWGWQIWLILGEKYALLEWQLRASRILRELARARCLPE